MKTINLTCQRKIPPCKHNWDYKGTNPFYATCPRCYTKVNIRNQIKDGPSRSNEIAKKSKKTNDR